MTDQTDLTKKQRDTIAYIQALWRPLTGWVLLAAIALQGVVRPVFNWVAVSIYHAQPMPALDMDMLMFMASVAGVLVVSRTVEKLNGAAGD